MMGRMSSSDLQMDLNSFVLLEAEAATSGCTTIRLHQVALKEPHKL